MAPGAGPGLVLQALREACGCSVPIRSRAHSPFLITRGTKNISGPATDPEHVSPAPDLGFFRGIVLALRD